MISTTLINIFLKVNINEYATDRVNISNPLNEFAQIIAKNMGVRGYQSKIVLNIYRVGTLT